jgi:hypothetical protein
MTELIPVAACLLIAFGIGSNDTSNAIGICIGCGVIKLRRALLLFGCFVLIGILVQGQKVMKTVGKDLVEVNLSIIGISLSVAALLIIISNWKKLPINASGNNREFGRVRGCFRSSSEFYSDPGDRSFVDRLSSGCFFLRPVPVQSNGKDHFKTVAVPHRKDFKVSIAPQWYFNSL